MFFETEQPRRARRRTHGLSADFNYMLMLAETDPEALQLYLDEQQALRDHERRRRDVGFKTACYSSIGTGLCASVFMLYLAATSPYTRGISDYVASVGACLPVGMITFFPALKIGEDVVFPLVERYEEKGKVQIAIDAAVVTGAVVCAKTLYNMVMNG